MITPSFPLTSTERVLPRLALDFTTAALDARVTFARSGDTATAVNSSGFVSSINADLPRFDYNPITLACKGLLIEEARTNSILQSEFATGWSLSGASLGTAAVTTPAGGATSVAIVEDTSTGLHYTFRGGLSITSGAVYTTSVYAKPNGRDFLEIQTSSNMGAVVAYFNLQTGVASNLSAGVTAAITPAGNGWFRCSVTRAATSTGTGAVYFITATAAGTDSYLGDGASGILVYGAQVEAGTFATSYIPTEATAVTRNADVASMTGTNFSDWYNATEGTAFAKGILLPSSLAVASRRAFWFDNSTTSQYANAWHVSANPAQSTLDSNVISSGVLQSTMRPSHTFTEGQVLSMCGAMKVSGSAVAINGGAPATAATATLPVGLNILRIGSHRDGSNWNGWLQGFRYWPQRVTNAEVQAISRG